MKMGVGEVIMFLVRMCICWFPLCFLITLPMLVFALPIAFYINPHDDSIWWTLISLMSCFFTWLLYSISETYKKFADYVWGLGIKILKWWEDGIWS